MNNFAVPAAIPRLARHSRHGSDYTWITSVFHKHRNTRRPSNADKKSRFKLEPAQLGNGGMTGEKRPPSAPSAEGMV
jgi:ribosomal protein L15E